MAIFSFGLLYLYLETSRYLVAYPTGDVLGRGIAGDDFVQILVVETVHHRLLDVGKVHDHASSFNSRERHRR